MIELITANLSSKTRQESADGRDFIVAPLTMIVPGVLNGSQGPLLYTANEIAKNPSAWDRIPIVVYHPVSKGTAVSAGENPESHVGFLKNPAVHNDRLVAEGWFDVEKTRSVDSRVLSDLQKGQPIELSTGLIVDQIPEPGEFEGVRYQALAVNYRPDHLAILPDQIGACSIKDGCGVLVNEARQQYFNSLRAKENTMAKLTDAQRKEVIDSLIANCDCWDEVDREVLNKVSDEKLEALQKHVEKVVQNQKVAEAARQGFKHGDVGYVFNEATLKFDAKPEQKPPKKEEEPTVTNKQEPSKPQTAEEWLATAPVEIQSVVRNSVKREYDEKQTLIKAITANKANRFTAEALLAKPLDELQAIADLAKVPEPQTVSYLGMSVPLTNTKAQEPSYDENDVLEIPTINWQEAANLRKQS